jgi:hypothetical protein
MLRTLSLAALLLASCASWTPVKYAPRAVQSQDLGEALARVAMTARAWRPVKVEVQETFAVFSYVNQFGPHTVTLPFREVAKIELLSNEAKEWDVDVLDKHGESLYRHIAHDEAKAREFFDVLSAVVKAL